MWEEYPFPAVKEMQIKPCVGISACLSGEKVRYDGQSKEQPDLISFLQPLLRLKPLCPEVAIGMGVPRPPIQLIINDNTINAVYLDDEETNFSDPLSQYGKNVLAQHGHEVAIENKLCGYIFKSRSPSCGAGTTPIFEEGVHVRFGDGIYAHTIRHHLPWLPIVDEEKLVHPKFRERFCFLVYLVNDFYIQLESSAGIQNFTEQHHTLIESLPTPIQNRIDSVASKYQDLHSQTHNYLTPLIRYLEDASNQDIESIIKHASGRQ